MHGPNLMPLVPKGLCAGDRQVSSAVFGMPRSVRIAGCGLSADSSRFRYINSLLFFFSFSVRSPTLDSRLVRDALGISRNCNCDVM